MSCSSLMMQDIRKTPTPLTRIFEMFHLLSANNCHYAQSEGLALSIRRESVCEREDEPPTDEPFKKPWQRNRFLERNKPQNRTYPPVYFLRKEQPSVRRALPPVGWQRTVVQPWQMTTVWAWEKTVVMVKQPGHLTSMKKDRGPGTRVY